jgi:hypothetical protein
MSYGSSDELGRRVDDLTRAAYKVRQDASNFAWANRASKRGTETHTYVLDPLNGIIRDISVARKLDTDAGLTAVGNLRERLTIIEKSLKQIKSNKTVTAGLIPKNKDSTTLASMSTRTGPASSTRSKTSLSVAAASRAAAPELPAAVPAGPVAAPSAAQLSQKDVEDMTRALNNPDVSEDVIEALGNRAIDSLPLVFDLETGFVEQVTQAYLKDAPDLGRFNSYAASVARDYARVFPESAQSATMVTLRGPGGDAAVDYNRAHALFSARQSLLEHYMEVMANRYETTTPRPDAGSALTAEFKAAVQLANALNTEYALDLDQLEKFRTEVGRLSDRSRPGIFRRAFSYATSFLNPFNTKTKRIISLSAIALAVGAAGVLAYNPGLYSSLGILDPDTAARGSAWLGRLFSRDFFNALSSGSQALLRAANAHIVPAADYVWSFLRGGGAGAAAAKVAPLANVLALPSAPYVAPAVAAQAAEAASPGLLASAAGAVAGAASSTYGYLANLFAANPNAAAAVAGGVGLAGVGASAAAINKLMVAKQVEDAGSAIKEATIEKLERDSKKITAAQGGGKAQVAAEGFAEIKAAANEVDAAGAVVAAAAERVKTERVSSSIPVNAPLTADPAVASAIAAVDNMAAAGQVLEHTSSKVTKQTLGSSGSSPKHMTKSGKSTKSSKASHKKKKKGSKKSPTKKRHHTKARSKKSIGGVRTTGSPKKRTSSSSTKKKTRRHTGTPRKRTASTTKRAKARASRRR